MTKHEYICNIVNAVKAKSTCYKRQVGAVFINNDFEILATGYNAPPKGFEHCDRTQNSLGNCHEPCQRNIHAELNAIAQAAKIGRVLHNSILYCNYLPCITCSRILINIGIKAVCIEYYNEDGGEEVLKKGNILINDWEFLGSL